MSTSVILRTKNLVKTYVTGTVETPALRGIEFELHKGEFTAIAGPSGSGKSTLLHLLGGLDRPTSGEIYLDGVALSALTRDALSKLRLEKMGFVFQAYNLIPVLTVLENAAFVLELRGVRERERMTRARKILAELGIEKYANQFPSRISGGEQQRVAVARALVNEPAILMADEPTGNLDSKVGQEIMDLLFKLNRERNTTLLIITHDPRIASQTQRTIRIQDGMVEENVQ
jgi:putative ABC transport system ATP-binding protein